VSRKAGSESKDIGDIFLWKDSAVPPGEYCEVGRGFAEGRRDGTAAFAVGAVACRAIFLIHLASRRNIGGGQLSFVVVPNPHR
jgi:hypothetical protein